MGCDGTDVVVDYFCDAVSSLVFLSLSSSVELVQGRLHCYVEKEILIWNSFFFELVAVEVDTFLKLECWVEETVVASSWNFHVVVDESKLLWH